jgi:hypothetical protein
VWALVVLGGSVGCVWFRFLVGFWLVVGWLIFWGWNWVARAIFRISFSIGLVSQLFFG